MKRTGKRDTHFFMYFNLGAETACAKVIALDKKTLSREQIAILCQTRTLIDWTVDDYSVDDGGRLCEVSLAKLKTWDKAD